MSWCSEGTSTVRPPYPPQEIRKSKPPKFFSTRSGLSHKKGRPLEAQKRFARLDACGHLTLCEVHGELDLTQHSPITAPNAARQMSSTTRSRRSKHGPFVADLYKQVLRPFAKFSLVDGERLGSQILFKNHLSHRFEGRRLDANEEGVAANEEGGHGLKGATWISCPESLSGCKPPFVNPWQG